MPIATCLMREASDMERDAASLVGRWAELSGCEAGLLTVDMLPARRLSGESRRAMGTLHLPTMWPKDKAERIALGLVRALSEWMGTGPEEVHLMIRWVESGTVVEDGEILTW